MSAVQGSSFGSPYRDPNDYPNEILVKLLEKRKVQRPKHPRRKVLLSIIESADRGLPTYETLPLSTLVTFLKQRGIHHAGRKIIKEIAAKLRDAVKARKFPLIIELTSEILEMVYEYALLDPWQEAEGNPAPSALTRVSNLVRKEVLEIAYRDAPLVYLLKSLKTFSTVLDAYRNGCAIYIQRCSHACSTWRSTLG